MSRYQKKITHPFNEKLRNRIFSPSFNSVSSSTSSSSGSEHDAVTSSPTPSPSPCLSYLVQNFLEDDSRTELTESTRDSGSGSDSDFDSGESVRPDITALVHSVVFPSIFDNADTFRKQLLANVTKAVEIFSIFRKNKSIFHRNLMSYLREIGYNAGVCKIRWTATGSLTAGNYEVIDVIATTSPSSLSSSTRYIIDTEFSGEFEIVRETERYAKLRSSLPRVFVGKADDVKRIVRLMCDEGRRSLKMNGLILPPWRKNRYMQMKWLGPYRRTVNHFPVKLNSPMVVNCRFVGFDVSDDCCGRGVLPAVMRMR